MTWPGGAVWHPTVGGSFPASGAAASPAAAANRPNAAFWASSARWRTARRQSTGRAEPGHWEGDLIIGKANASAVATLVERTSRHTLAVPLLNGYDAASTATAVSAALMRQPRHLLKTLTWDQGREMARWPDIEQNTGIKVYFCEPRSPWQRPTNEQTNGLLRRWLPKGTNLNIGAVRLALIQDSINLMPRKLHDWNSAHSVYTELCRNDR